MNSLEKDVSEENRESGRVGGGKKDTLFLSYFQWVTRSNNSMRSLGSGSSGGTVLECTSAREST